MSLINKNIIYYYHRFLINFNLVNHNQPRCSYTKRDHEVIDYHAYKIGNLPYEFRGPKPNLTPGDYVAFIGAAQTFGCFANEPFPDLIQKHLNVATLNLGIGGAGPSYFVVPELLPLVNNAKVVVVQVMSGRSVENAYMKDCGGKVTVRKTGERITAKEAYKRVQAISEDYANQIVQETRDNYIREYEDLLCKITPPKILFWFSKREPDYIEDYGKERHILGGFPQLVNQEMLEKIADKCDAYVNCTTNRGSPQRHISRTTGKPVSIISRPGMRPKTHNHYYPSPEMHEDAARSLLPVISNFL